MKSLRLLFCAVLLLGARGALCQTSEPDGRFSQPKTTHELDGILEKVEKRYGLPGFSARFFQVSTIKDMKIEDTASGSILVKRPNKMRWEYEKPEKQIIITDGIQLWIYRPEDSQVMIGRAPSFFGDGKGAVFLSDIKQIRRQFAASLEPADSGGVHLLKLLPRKRTYELSEIYLSVSKKTHEVVRIVTINAHGDETRIDLIGYRFLQNPDDSKFRFIVPKGTDVLELKE
jgi:outer membrane lipoprotein carrier protein